MLITLITYCEKIVPFIDFYKKQTSLYNCTAHEILMNEISLMLPNFPKDRKEKRSILSSEVIGFIFIVCEGIFSYLHNKKQRSLHKAFMAMNNKINLQSNKIIYLENSMVICSYYNLDNLEKSINTIHKMHNSTAWNEKLFPINLILGIIAIYLRMELSIMSSILSYI